MKKIKIVFVFLLALTTISVGFFQNKVTALDADSTVVYTFADLKTAVTTNNGIINIYLGADIIMESGGIAIPTFKTELVIDGVYPLDEDAVVHRLTDYDSASITNTFYVASVVGSMSVTFQNMNITGKNYYGILAAADATSTSNLTVTFNNVNYVGVQMNYVRYATVYYMDTNITIEDDSASCSMNEVAEANKIVLGGTVVIQDPNTANAVFQMTNTNPAFQVLPDANVSITNVSNYANFYCGSAIDVDIGAGAIVTFNTKYGLFYSTGVHQAKSFIIRENASINITQTDRNTNSAGTIRCSGDFTVSDGASLYITAAFDSATPLIQFSASATASFNNPSSVVLYNKGGRVIDWASGTGTISIDSELVNYWTTAKDFPTAGTATDTPLYAWNKSDASNVTILATVTSSLTTSVTTNVTILDNLILPSAITFNVQSARVLALGRLPFSVDTANTNKNTTTGTTTPGATLSISYLFNLVPISATTTALDDGSFTVSLQSLLPGGTAITITSNYEFKTKTMSIIVVDLGSLSFKTVPETLEFEDSAIPSTKTLIGRKIPNWSMTISDTRLISVDWSLYASVEAPMTSEEGHTLNNALVFIDDNGISHTLDNTLTAVFSGEANLGISKDTTVSWSPNKGILLYPNPSELYVGEYATTITWTLADAP